MTTDEMREAVKNVYPWRPWQERVARMSDEQVFVIYTRLKKQNKV